MTTDTASAPVSPAATSLLRFATAGSVDDGKSTLVGRLLHDSKAVLADQLDAVQRASRARGRDEPDLALLTDGLRAEREQGITIDVAHRYFATPARRFVLADTPGHEQYTRNMVTGASTAQAAVVLVDARHGVTTQTRRHAAVTALLRVPHLLLAVNKMDLVDWDEAVFARIGKEFAGYAASLGAPDATAVPVSALHGDNVAAPSPHLDWYAGPTVLEYLEAVPASDAEDLHAPARLPVQYVIRPGRGEHRDYRGYAGRLASGTLSVGDAVTVLPAGTRSTVAALDVLGRAVPTARAGQSLTVRLADDLDVSRGDLIAPAGHAPEPVTEVSATVCHLDDTPLRPGDRVLLQHGTRTVRARVSSLDHRLDIDTLERDTDAAELRANDIAALTLRTAEPVAPDPYTGNRQTGSFLLVDPDDGTTRTAGMAGHRLGAA